MTNSTCKCANFYVVNSVPNVHEAFSSVAPNQFTMQLRTIENEAGNRLGTLLLSLSSSYISSNTVSCTDT